jgi:flagellar basal-body rod protein FlgG
MLRSLWTAATGMVAQQSNIDVISNNLANVNTTGFKKSRAEFQDLLYQTIRPAGVTDNLGTQLPTPIEIGHGVKLAATTKSFTQGDMVQTGNPLDLVIQGDGFFQVQKPNGDIAYTRDGSFKSDSSGNIVTSEGYFLQPAITLPAATSNIVVRENGDVSVTVQGQAQSSVIGSIRLVNFANPAGLESLGQNLYAESEASGQPIEGTPGVDGVGSIGEGMLESSNVKVVEEMVNMIASQRAYEINGKAVTTSDNMLSIANNLRG